MEKIKEIILREFSSIEDINDFFLNDKTIKIISIQYTEFKRSHLVYYTYK